MAEALLRARLSAAGVDGVDGVNGVTVSSAGLLPGGAPATEDAARAVPGQGVEDHVSRQLTRELVDGAGLIVAMARRHLREAAVLSPSAFARTFTLRELVRRASAVGARGAGESLDAWLGRVGAGRRPADHLGDADEDDIADPIGRPFAEYEATAAELDDLLARFVALAWP